MRKAKLAAQARKAAAAKMKADRKKRQKEARIARRGA